MADRPPTILVVDDDRVFLAALGEVLEAEGYAVLTSPSGTRAHEVFLDHRPDLVVLDSGRSGVAPGDALARLRFIAPTVPVILSTGRSEPEARGAARDLGPTAFLRKPYDVTALIGQVARLLDEASQRAKASARVRQRPAD